MIFLFLSCASQTDVPSSNTSEIIEGAVENSYVSSFTPTDTPIVAEELVHSQSISSLHSHTLFFSDNNEIYVQKEPEPPTMIAEGTYVNANSFQDTTLLSVDGTLYIQSAEDWTISPLSQINGHTTESIYSTQDTLFLLGAGQLHAWSNGTTRQISIPDQSILDIGLKDTSVILRTPWLYSYDTQTKETSTLWEEPVSSFCVDGEKNIWFSQHQTLYKQDTEDTLISFVLPSDITNLMANPKGKGIWIQTQETHYFYRNQDFFDVGWAGQNWLDVDEHDRLIVGDEEQVHRISIDRPTVIQGLNKNDALTTRKDLILLPSDPEAVQSLQVFIAGTELNVQESWSFQLNPDDFPTGSHDIHIVQHTNENTFLTIHPFVNQELPLVFWEEEILPLHEENCASCHGGATETALTSKEEWIQNIEIIIDVVTSQSMPLGAPPLSEEQITTIRAWKQGGFQ